MNGAGKSVSWLARSQKKSSLIWGFCKSARFSALRPSSTARQRPQGFWPLKVFSSATVMGSVREKSTAMPTQAIDWRKNQWLPVAKTTANTTNHLPKRIGIADKRLLFTGGGGQAEVNSLWIILP